ncbi:hypothetical protein [Phaeobacter sp. HF9A]|uniref:hypothetical protein n=1 Tax=Phaeobacter sp. HF9A TaxID=2721561 RepID=UPI0014307EE0|nr:hypothetical protein [Phaeobacter sp. HF9A]NIZ12019.1 hypothetical protein [Phaeobacter sp. HF9A]
MSNETAATGLAARFGLSSTDLLPIARKAAQKLGSGQAEEAMRLFAQLVLACPDNRDFQIGLAEAALLADQPALALQAASAAIAFDAKGADGYLLSGRACLALEDRAAAREDFAEALSCARALPDDKAQARIATLAEGCLAALAEDHD